MANNVFANGLEIACKAADGKSIAAFPDPCFTPPPPSGGWVLIPYANTAYAKDTANASKTVFISGKPIMKKDVSFFKTSTGNEPAAGPLGKSTGVKKGKAYFASWSMNVKVEGQNVDRHSDEMTHNHGSKAGNTGAWKYWDTSMFGDPCKKELERVEKACGGMKKRKNAKFYQSEWKKNTKYKKGDWKRKHCKLLSIKPTSGGLKGIESPAKLLKELKAQISETDVMSSAISQASDAAIDLATKQLAKLGVKFVAGKAVPIAGWVYSALTAVDDFRQVKYYKAMYDGAVAESKRILDQVQNVRKDIQETITAVEKGNFKGVSKKLSDWQRSAATVDDCLRARKCMLVPMKETYNKPGSVSKGKANSGGNDTNRGCCAGQTGHHLIPDSFIKGAGCKGYGPAKKSSGYWAAPVVCAEGTRASHVFGSHGAIHTATTEMLVPKKKWGSTKTTKASYGKVRDGVVKAHAKAFPFSACSHDCLRSQLDKFYDDKQCDDLTVKQIGSNPGTVVTGGVD